MPPVEIMADAKVCGVPSRDKANLQTHQDHTSLLHQQFHNMCECACLFLPNAGFRLGNHIITG